MLRESVFRTTDLPAEHRLDGFRECLVKSLFPQDLVAEQAGGFRAEVRLLEIGEVRVWSTAVQPVRFVRTPRLIRQADPELYHLTLPLQGTVDIAQAGRRARHTAHEMYLVDSSRPFECVTRDFAGVGLSLPRNRVPLPPDGIERLLTRRMPAGEGVGALLAGVLTQIASGGPYLPSDAPRLERVVVDLFCATLAHHLDAEDRTAPEARSRDLTVSIRAFIERGLHDPELAPPAIAAAHHISLSYLHRLFRAEGTTVAALIRRMRLERAHRDLGDPALAATPIHAIASRWGFKSHADFTRSYRGAYGTSPQEHRRGAPRRGLHPVPSGQGAAA
ncbi:helix-turn-helix domain-containing protein [Streptomyces sp. TS71-3]|uniref:AraC-like ligand-binding domain-containing protein n=1 Tax=Streptomyces sp. TS71-3 TaxID=2733862 RepID=UPI001B2C319E|nr:helix-turn-helix domain-containing protein [Streptomyces sp. TS71-3]GHJ41409.1 AraC family transcriptional regulator [Streptomyces sp. TS71-3]